MTVSVPGQLVYAYNGDGSVQVFAYPVRFLADAELTVVLQSADGTQAQKTLNTDYTVADAGEESGGSVTMSTAPATGEKLYIFRDTSPTQSLELADAVRTPAASVEDQLDRLAMAVQDSSDRVSKFAPGQSPIPANHYPLFDAHGQMVDGGSGVDIAGAQASAEAAQADAATAQDARDATLAAMSSVVPNVFATKTTAEAYDPDVAPDFINLTGGASVNDIGAITPFSKVASEPTDLPAPAIVQLLDGTFYRWAGREFPLELGAKGDGTTDNASFFNDLGSAFGTFAGVISAGRGIFKTSKPLIFPKAASFIGQGLAATKIDGSGIAAVGDVFGGVLNIDQSDYLTALPGLASDMTSRTEIPLSDASGVDAGDWVCLYNPTDYSWLNISGRPTYRAGEWFRVGYKDGDTLIPTEPLWFMYNAADVDVYLMKAPQVVLRDFVVQAPFLEMPAVALDCSINPIVENVDCYGSSYGGISLKRIIEPYVNCHIFQREVDPTLGLQYALVLGTVHGGEIHGAYHSQRHGIAQGNGDYICCVPNRKTKVFADTSGYDGVGSLDFGHGCSQGLELHGGTHSGLMLGGADHRFIGGHIRKAEARGSGSTSGGILLSGSEFAGGTFHFLGTAFDAEADAFSLAAGDGPITLTLLSCVSADITFVFDDCVFLNPGKSQYYYLYFVNAGCTFEPSLVIRNPHLEDPSGKISYLAKLDWVSGAKNWSLVQITGESGIADTVMRLVVANGATSSKWKFEGQQGQVTLAGDTGAANVSAAVTYGYAYPEGAVPQITLSNGSQTIGDNVYAAYPTTVTKSGFTANAQTYSGANFGSTGEGTLNWRASF